GSSASCASGCRPPLTITRPPLRITHSPASRSVAAKAAMAARRPARHGNSREIHPRGSPPPRPGDAILVLDDPPLAPGSRKGKSRKDSGPEIMNLRLQGIFPPIATPFDHNGNIYRAKIQHNVEKWNLTALAGYVVMGSTGESVMLTSEEKFTVWEE